MRRSESDTMTATILKSASTRVAHTRNPWHKRRSKGGKTMKVKILSPVKSSLSSECISGNGQDSKCCAGVIQYGKSRVGCGRKMWGNNGGIREDTASILIP